MAITPYANTAVIRRRPRGRDTRKSEKIVWPAAIRKLQNCRIKSRQDNIAIPYQRGAKAIARQIARETKGKLSPTAEEAQQYIDGFYATYVEVEQYVETCKAAVCKPGFVGNPYGRRRRFYNMARSERSQLAACEREAVNMPIQSTVADTLNVALFNLYAWRHLYPGRCNYKILLAVHDAVLIEVPGEEAHIVYNEVLPHCMRYGAVVPSWNPAPWAKYPPTQPFMLDIDREVCVRWGEEASPEELEEAGVLPAYVAQWTKHD